MDRKGGIFFLFFNPILPKQRLVSSRLVKDRVELTPATIVVNIIASCAPGPVKRSELENGVINVQPAVVNVGLLHLNSFIVTCLWGRRLYRSAHVTSPFCGINSIGPEDFSVVSCSEGLDPSSALSGSSPVVQKPSLTKVLYLFDSIYTGYGSHIRYTCMRRVEGFENNKNPPGSIQNPRLLSRGSATSFDPT